MRKTRAPFLIDYSIRAARIPKVSFADVLRGDEATLQKLEGKKVIVGGTALELGDRFSVPNGRSSPAPCCKPSPRSRCCSTARCSGPRIRDGGRPVLLAMMMLITWRRLSAGRRVALLVAIALAVETAALALQAVFPFILDTSLFHIASIAYLAAIALDEINIRALLGQVAENRFQRVAMSLGDGLICTDSKYVITDWNPGATAIFGHPPEAMIGRPFDEICAHDLTSAMPDFSIDNIARLPSGSVIEFDGRRSNGEVFPVEASFSRWQGADGYQFGAILRDISVRRREAAKIQYLAEHDTLTGLINRHTLLVRLAGVIAKAKADSHEVALLVIGLEGFQQVNQMLGHASGDLVLRAISERLAARIPGSGVVARLNGDEFAIAARLADIGGSIKNYAEQIGACFHAPLLAGNREHRVRVSIGAAVFPDGGDTADELLSNSHMALSRARATRRGSHVLFEDSIRRDLETRLTLEAELALAVNREEFELFYQPQRHLADGRLIGAEALIRWRHPVRGLVSPAEFMPVVNTSPISDRIAGWVINTACAKAAAWERSGHAVRIGVNLSPSLLRSGDLPNTVQRALASRASAQPISNSKSPKISCWMTKRVRWIRFSRSRSSAFASCSTISAPALPASAI